MHVRDRLYIDGSWVAGSGTGTVEIVDSVTEEVMGRVPEGTAEDVDRAVGAASAAFEEWSTAPVEARAKYLQAMHDGLMARTHEIATLVAREVGMTLPMAKLIQAAVPAMIMASYVEIASDYPFEEQVGNSLVVREAAGVVGAITPWNYPLYVLAAKVSPALLAGCPVVVKPSEVAPLTAFVLADVAEEVGLPPGVFNLVSGEPAIGEALACHPGVDLVSFTGSTPGGIRVAELAARSLKRVVLELGGKSPLIILDDADIDEAVRAGVGQCLLNSGQTCLAWSRMLVPRSRHDEVAGLARDVAATFTLGDPLEGEAKLGPLATKAHQERVRRYIRMGIEEGATLVTGGPEQPEGLPRGYYVEPTVFADVNSEMTIAREEIFGPVLCIIPYDDEDDAVSIANDTVYGLSGAVFSRDSERALRVARRLRSGQVDISGGGYNLLAPFGGYKQSGLGRELGKWGLEEYLEVKSLQL